MFKLLIAICLLSVNLWGISQSISYKPYSKTYNKPVGGIKDVQLMFSKEFQYPIDAVKNQIEGNVVLSYVLEPGGTVAQLKIASSPSEILSQEAIRLFKKIQWTKEQYRPVHMTLRDKFTVEFSLKKWVKLYSKRNYQYIDYEIEPIDTSAKVFFVKALPIQPIPVFRDGEYSSFNHYIARKMRYPEAALKLDLKGTVLIAFVVEPSGQISNIEVRKGMNGGCTQEALRLIKNVTWIPGQKDGKAVRTQMHTSIGFGVNSDAFYQDGR